MPRYDVSKEKAKSLGIEFIPLDVSLKETVESLKEKKLVNFYVPKDLLVTFQASICSRDHLEEIMKLGARNKCKNCDVMSFEAENKP